MGIEELIPTICLARDSVSAYGIFNPNDWSGQSRLIVDSCAAFAGVMSYDVEKISRVCAERKKVCGPCFKRLVAQAADLGYVVGLIRPFAQVPELHSAIVSFLVGAKGVLDFLTQLTCAEGLVGTKLDGFHRDGEVYGGRLLNALKRNSPKIKEEAAKEFAALICSHKKQWIDGLIKARDELTHPEKGMQQLMFEMRIDTTADDPTLADVIPPKVGGQSVDLYVRDVQSGCMEFARAALDCLAKS